jgi:hypothetical protein
VDIPVAPERNPYGLPQERDEATSPATLPKEGERIGVRYGVNSPYLPYRVVIVTPRRVILESPINHSRFAFDRRDTWYWLPWDACPGLREPCPRCKGKTVVLNKKSGNEQSCPKCRGRGAVKRDDPFNA